MHEDVLELTTVDAIGTGPGACQPVLLHWGDLRKANQAADTALGARCCPTDCDPRPPAP